MAESLKGARIVKRSFAICVLLLGAGACISEESPIKLGPAYTLLGTAAAPGTQGTCNINSAEEVGGGSLDISATPFYEVAFGEESDLVSPGITNSNGIQVGSPSDNDFVVEQVLLTYTSTPTLPLQPEAVNVGGVVFAGSAPPQAWLAMNIIGPKAAQVLETNVTPGNNYDVVIGLQLSGHLRNGEGPTTSNHFKYPVTVYNSGFAGCGAGGFKLPSGPCGIPGGQDGTFVGCCPTDGGTFNGCP